MVAVATHFTLSFTRQLCLFRIILVVKNSANLSFMPNILIVGKAICGWEEGIEEGEN